MAMSDAASTTKVALIFILLGFIVHIIGFGAPYWVVYDVPIFGSHEGLWQVCSDLTDSCSEIDLDSVKFGVDDWFQAVRTFECFGLIGSVATIIFVGLYICLGRCSGNKCIAILNVILALGTGVCILIAIIIYGSKRDNLHWAFGLATAGGVCYALAGIFILVSLCQ